jgi:hypothetical protein
MSIESPSWEPVPFASGRTSILSARIDVLLTSNLEIVLATGTVEFGAISGRASYAATTIPSPRWRG